MRDARAGKRRRERIPVKEIGLNHAEGFVLRQFGGAIALQLDGIEWREGIDTDHRLAATEERVGAVKADKAGRAGDEVSQPKILRSDLERLA